MSTQKDPRAPKIVLIAEDNSTNIIILVKMVEKLGFRALVAKDGIEAIEILQGAHPRMILMDINMPRMDGIAAARKIRELELADGSPIIAVTAKPMPSGMDELAEMKLDGFISKPIRMSDLSAALEKCSHPETAD